MHPPAHRTIARLPVAALTLTAILFGLAATTLLGGCGSARATSDPPLHVARLAVAPGCLLPRSPDLQPYRCGGALAGTFNQAIPANAPIDPLSGAFIAQMIDSMRQTRVQLNNSDGAAGVWVAGGGDPVWTVTSATGQRTIRFPMPAQARPAPGSDAPLLVYAPSGSAFGPFTELRAWRAGVDPTRHVIHTTEYGLFHYGRNSGGGPFYGNGTGYGLSWGGLIRAWEVRTGSIDHALRASAPINTRYFRAPAIRSDCIRSADNPCSGLVAEGLRLQLSPAVDCATRTVPFADPDGRDTRFLREVCRALQVYGMIIVDGSGDPNLYGLFMEQGSDTGGTANWDAILNRPPGGLWGNIIRDVNASATGDGVQRDASTGIPWNEMRVLHTSVFTGR
jgi:hypothetical protein